MSQILSHGYVLSRKLTLYGFLILSCCYTFVRVSEHFKYHANDILKRSHIFYIRNNH